ncbi:MAG: hypothetical protein SFU85_02055 [Candidatus Methylacidiphilales bacterium]|nr:hypothetical protein [Candidatus Methylacidiphilales bacterium]
MNFIRQRPWILLIILFCLPIVAWTVFFILASRHPVQKLPPEPAAQSASPAHDP